MIVVRTLAEFAKHNHNELFALARHASRRASRYASRQSRRDVEDMVQEWYITAARTKLLDKYDESKGPFNTYCVRALFWGPKEQTAEMVPLDAIPQRACFQDDLRLRVESFRAFLGRYNKETLSLVLAELERRVVDKGTRNCAAAFEYERCTKAFRKAERS